MSREPRGTDHDITATVQRAISGDREAWEALVRARTGMLWAIARGYGLSEQDASDAVQTSWLRLVEHLSGIRDPAAVGAWLATTLRRECLTTLRRRRRERAVDTLREFTSRPDDLVDVERDGMRGVVRHELLEAVRRLPRRQQLVLRVLATTPTPTYEEVSRAVGIPVGSIGPTRARALRRLRDLLDQPPADHGLAS
jgi:RNA polymerase sigma factor (sigma-70 family)